MFALDGILDQGAVQRVCDILSRAEWEDGRATARGVAGEVKQNRQAKASPEIAECQSMITQATNASVVLTRLTLPAKITMPIFSLTEKGGRYGWHLDTALMRGPLRTDLSITLFLSDPDSYEGGELEIDGLPPVKLAAGSAIVYSTERIHRVRDVTRGARYAAILWIQSMIQDDKKREIVTELAQLYDWALSVAPDGAEARRIDQIKSMLFRRWMDKP